MTASAADTLALLRTCAEQRVDDDYSIVAIAFLIRQLDELEAELRATRAALRRLQDITL